MVLRPERHFFAERKLNMTYILSIIDSFLTWCCVFFPLTNFLIYPLKRSHKYIFFIFLTVIDCLLFRRIGVFANLITLLLIMLFVILSTSHPAINAAFAILGYLFTVCLNYIIVLALRPLNISVIMLETTYYSIFNVSFIVISCLASYYLGKIIRPHVLGWQLTHHQPFLSKTVQFLCILEVLACFCIYQFNIIYGKLASYSSQIVTYNAMLFFSFFIITMVILCFLIKTLKRDAELLNKLKESEILQDYTAKVESLYLEIRTFKHDYLNILSTMELYMKEKRYTDLQHYFESKILPQGRSLVSNDAVLGKLAKLKIPELKSLLYPKLLVALNHHLDAVVDIKNDTTSIPVDYLDLTRILGIFMDNAIEAAVETQEKTLYIGFHTYDNTTIIRIRNSCNPVEHIDHIFDLDYSTKPGSRGIGLYNANLLIHKHPNIILKTTCGDNMFTQELKIIEGD